MFCNYCGASNDNDASFCSACGKAISRAGANVSATASAIPHAAPPSPQGTVTDTTAWVSEASTFPEKVRTLTGHSRSGIHSLAFSPDGRWLVSGGRYSFESFKAKAREPIRRAPYDTAKLWDVIAAREARVFIGKLPFQCVAFSPDGCFVALGASKSEDKTVENSITIWDPASPNQVRNFVGHEGLVDSLQFSPDGHLLGSTDGKGTTYLWAFSSGQLIRVFKPGRIVRAFGGSYLHNGRSLAFSPDGRLLATKSWGVDIWDLSTGALMRTIARDWMSSTVFLSFTSDSRSLVEVRATGAIRIWDVLSGNETRCLVDPPKRKGVAFLAQDAALDSNASRLAVNTDCSADEPRVKITLWDVANGRTLGTLHTDSDGDTLALSPDGQWLAADSGRVREEGELFVDEIRLWKTSDLG